MHRCLLSRVLNELFVKVLLQRMSGCSLEGKCSVAVLLSGGTSQTQTTPKRFQQHKDACKKNAEHVEELAKADESGFSSPFLPPGVTFAELDHRLEKWVKFHNSTLMAATIHALALPRDLTRSRTYVLRMTVRARTDHNGVTGKFFRVTDAQVIEIAEAQRWPPPWPESLEQLALLREESESKRRGTVAAIGVECPPLGVQLVPFGSLRDLSPLRILSDWKDILRRDVEDGKKFTRFGS